MQIIVILANTGCLVKPLSNHLATLSPENLENKQLSGLRPDPSCL